MQKTELFYLFYFLKYLSLKLWPLTKHHPLLSIYRLLYRKHCPEMAELYNHIEQSQYRLLSRYLFLSVQELAY